MSPLIWRPTAETHGSIVRENMSSAIHDLVPMQAGELIASIPLSTVTDLGPEGASLPVRC